MESKGSDAAGVLVGMPEVMVIAAVEDDGELWLLVETKDSVTGRPETRLAGGSGHGMSIDPPRGLPQRLSPHLDHAMVVVDPFHITRLGNRALDDVRRRTRKELTGQRGPKGDPLYDIRKILLTGAERLGEQGWQRLMNAYTPVIPMTTCWPAGPPKGTFAWAWAVGHGHGQRGRGGCMPLRIPTTARLLDAVILECKDSAIPELVRLAGHPAPLA